MTPNLIRRSLVLVDRDLVVGEVADCWDLENRACEGYVVDEGGSILTSKGEKRGDARRLLFPP